MIYSSSAKEPFYFQETLGFFKTLESEKRMGIQHFWLSIFLPFLTQLMEDLVWQSVMIYVSQN